MRTDRLTVKNKTAKLVLLALTVSAAGETLDTCFTCRFSRSPAVYTGPSDT